MIQSKAHGEESRWVGEPGLDDGGGVKEDVAAGAGGEEGGEVGDIAVSELDGGRQGAEIAAPPHEHPHGVAFRHQTATEPAAQVPGRPRHHHLHSRFDSLLRLPSLSPLDFKSWQYPRVEWIQNFRSLSSDGGWQGNRLDSDRIGHHLITRVTMG